MRVRSVAAAALAGAAAVAGMSAGGAAAGPAVKTAKISTLRLRVGDQVHVSGSSISCVVQKSGATVNFACVLGTLGTPVAHSYAVGIADKGADLARVSLGGGSAKIADGRGRSRRSRARRSRRRPASRAPSRSRRRRRSWSAARISSARCRPPTRRST